MLKSRSHQCFWGLVIAFPIIACIVFALCMPLGEPVALHWNFQGKVDRWGSPWDMMLSGAIIACVNATMAFSYKHIDYFDQSKKLFKPSRTTSRRLLMGAAIFTDVIQLVILLVSASTA